MQRLNSFCLRLLIKRRPCKSDRFPDPSADNFIKVRSKLALPEKEPPADNSVHVIGMDLLLSLIVSFSFKLLKSLVQFEYNLLQKEIFKPWEHLAL